MSTDRLIDPVTGDVQDGTAGGFLLDDDLPNLIIMSLSIPLGSWEGDPTFGHELDTLAREIDTADTRARIPDMVQRALKWLVDLGRLSTIEVDVMDYQPGIVAFQPRCYEPGARKPVAGVGPQYVAVGGA